MSGIQVALRLKIKKAQQTLRRVGYSRKSSGKYRLRVWRRRSMQSEIAKVIAEAGKQHAGDQYHQRNKERYGELKV